LETFNGPKDPEYPKIRKYTLEALDLKCIDESIVDIVAGFAEFPHCFTLQCCYGHFLCSPQDNPLNLKPIPRDYDGQVRYRIAYIAFCIENSSRGRALRDSLVRFTSIDPENIQFGSPDWFWEQRVNSYALQVAPTAHQYKDAAVLEFADALRTQRARNLFFNELRVFIAQEKRASGSTNRPKAAISWFPG
jgi:hypothetical protein